MEKYFLFMILIGADNLIKAYKISSFAFFDSQERLIAP